MTDRILLIMPTRGRPWYALESIASVMKNAAEPSMLKILVCCDHDDSNRIGLFTPNLSVSTSVKPRMRFVELVNFACDYYQGKCEWIAWWGDDCRMLTQGWDTIVREHKELVVWGEDGYQNDKMATHPFIRTAIPRALGYLLPNELVHYCPDRFIQELADAAGSIAYDPRIKIDHLHPDAGKGLIDQTYLDARSAGAKDKAVFESLIHPRIPELANLVKGYVETHR